MLKTFSMLNQAHSDGKIYRAVGGQCAYQRTKGLFDINNGDKWPLSSWDFINENFIGIDKLADTEWEEYHKDE